MEVSTGGLMPTEQLTIRQIAKLAGTSRSSVSRVLNNHPNVSTEVRTQVQEVIAETGYQPNPIARSLSDRRSSIIGLVVPLAIRSLFDDPFFPRLYPGHFAGLQCPRVYLFSLSLSFSGGGKRTRPQNFTQTTTGWCCRHCHSHRRCTDSTASGQPGSLGGSGTARGSQGQLCGRRQRDWRHDGCLPPAAVGVPTNCHRRRSL